MVYFGLAAGPAFGGFLADTFGWRWIFLVNVPLGFIAAAITVTAIAADDQRAARQAFDFAGALAFFAALTSLLLLLGGAGHAPSWPAGGTPLLLAFPTAVAAFIWIELKRSQPMIDLRLFKSRLFAAATASAMINYMGFSALTFLVPFYLVDGMEYGASGAGAFITAMPLAMTIAAPLSGWLSDKLGSRIPASAGMSLLCAGIFYLGVRGAASAAEIVPGLLLAGLGLGLFSSANNSAIMGSVSMDRQGIASGVVSTARQLGMMLGVAVSTTVFRAHYPLYAGLGQSEATAAAVRQALLVISGIVGVGFLTSLVRGAQGAPSPRAD
jgi:MFS family permease